MISHHASHRGRYVRPPTPRSAPGRPPHRNRRPRACRPTATADPTSAAPPARRPAPIPSATPSPDRPPRRVVGNSCLVLRRSAAAPSLRARGFALRHHPGVADADRGDARSRPEPSPPAPPARPAATPPPRHPAQPALRVASRCGQFLPGVAPSCASPGTPGPGFGAAAPARSCRHECATTRAHGARARGTVLTRRARPHCRAPPPRHAGACGRRQREAQPARASRRAVP